MRLEPRHLEHPIVEVGVLEVVETAAGEGRMRPVAETDIHHNHPDCIGRIARHIEGTHHILAGGLHMGILPGEHTPDRARSSHMGVAVLRHRVAVVAVAASDLMGRMAGQAAMRKRQG